MKNQKKDVIIFQYNYDEVYKIVKVKGRPSSIPKEADLKKCYFKLLPISTMKKITLR